MCEHQKWCVHGGMQSQKNRICLNAAVFAKSAPHSTGPAKQKRCVINKTKTNIIFYEFLCAIKKIKWIATHKLMNKKTFIFSCCQNMLWTWNPEKTLTYTAVCQKSNFEANFEAGVKVISKILNVHFQFRSVVRHAWREYERMWREYFIPSCTHTPTIRVADTRLCPKQAFAWRWEW